jgi:hypothetical protein
MIKKLTKENNTEKKIKKRVASEKWIFDQKYFNFDHLWKIINDINNSQYDTDITKITLQEINKKISSYKQQDILKKRWDENKFLTLECILKKMIECELKCRYCKCEIFVLYDKSREMKQWSIDRIDNNLGHNKDNFHLACLECNLQRRRRTDDKFLFTKQLNIIKQET